MLPTTWEIIVPFPVDGPLHSFDPEVGAAIDADCNGSGRHWR
jgi:hypothetical protein